MQTNSSGFQPLPSASRSIKRGKKDQIRKISLQLVTVEQWRRGGARSRRVARPTASLSTAPPASPSIASKEAAARTNRGKIRTNNKKIKAKTKNRIPQNPRLLLRVPSSFSSPSVAEAARGGAESPTPSSSPPSTSPHDLSPITRYCQF